MCYYNEAGVKELMRIKIFAETEDLKSTGKVASAEMKRDRMSRFFISKIGETVQAVRHGEL